MQISISCTSKCVSLYSDTKLPGCFTLSKIEKTDNGAIRFIFKQSDAGNPFNRTVAGRENFRWTTATNVSHIPKFGLMTVNADYNEQGITLQVGPILKPWKERHRRLPEVKQTAKPASTVSLATMVQAINAERERAGPGMELFINPEGFLRIRIEIG